MEELPQPVADKVCKWLGVHSIAHFWQDGETYYIVARDTSGSQPHNIYCLRVFPIGGEFVLSQDNVVYQV